jgi:hypothetical protein
MPELCGKGNCGPCEANNKTDALTDTCSASVNWLHQIPSSSVYSISHAMDQIMYFIEYSVKSIFLETPTSCLRPNCFAAIVNIFNNLALRSKWYGVDRHDRGHN